MEDLNKYLRYDDITGILYWKTAPSKRTKVDSEAGYLRPDGYLAIRFRGKNYFAHRVAWYLHTGEWPKETLDHINRIKNDNRIENLRDVTHRENTSNRTSFNFGASYHKTANKWKSQIKIGTKAYHLGLYDTEEEAQQAYRNKLAELLV